MIIKDMRMEASVKFRLSIKKHPKYESKTAHRGESKNTHGHKEGNKTFIIPLLDRNIKLLFVCLVL